LGRWGGAPYFVKFSSQCARQIPMIRRAMPGVPEIFLYRSPLEVLVGNLRAPTQSWLWQEKHTGVPLAAALERPLVELLARGIGRSMQGLLDHLTDSTLLMNYSEIGPDTPQALLDAFGIPAADEVRAAMAATLVLDAKDALKQKLFQRDIETKRAAATAMQRDLIAEFADGPFRALEARRLARRGIATAVASAMPTLTHTGPISSRST
jgi:hypothetical protein